MVEGAAPAREARIERRVAERRVALMLQYSRRLPAVYVGYAVVAVLAGWQHPSPWPWVWLVCCGVVMVYRTALGRSIEKRTPDERVAALPSLVNGFTLNGVTTAPIVVVSFLAPDTITPLMVGIGLVAGCAVGAASVAGSQRAFMGFCSLTFLLLAAGWAWRGGAMGIALAIGIVAMYLVLFGSVRDHGRNLHEVMRLVEDNAELSESVRQERDRAEAASEAKTRFFAAASHDLRQPLHALSINATTLDILAQRTADPLLKEVSRGIGSALRQSTSLLDGLLDISRLDAHSIQARMAAQDIGALLRAAHEEYSALAARQNLFLKLELDDGPLWAWTDGDQLMRIVGNLLSNAVKFTAQGGVTLRARREPDGPLLLQVVDTGPGIAAAERAHVFEEFYQIGNPSRDRAQGLGLGLAIVRRTAALLDIALDLQSEPGRGSTFSLRIPAAPAPEAAPPQAKPRAIADAQLAVLLVDDEPEVLAAMGTYLSQLGWSVRGVSDGDEAERTLNDGFDPDVMVVDFRLRHETGVDVIERLRRRKARLPAVIVTGETAPARFRASSQVAAKVLHKPLHGETLARTLRDVVHELDAVTEVPAG